MKLHSISFTELYSTFSRNYWQNSIKYLQKTVSFYIPWNIWNIENNIISDHIICIYSVLFQKSSNNIPI